MKSIVLKLVASASLKLGVAYALRIVISAIGGLRGILSEGGVSDESRRTIITIIAVLAAVRDFLSKVAELIGAPALPAYASSHAELEKLADGLNNITDGL